MCHTDQILFFVSFSLQLFSFPFDLYIQLFGGGECFYFSSCIRYLTGFQHHTVHSLTCSCLCISTYYGKLLQIAELKARKRETYALEVLFLGPFSFCLPSPNILYMNVYAVCVWVCVWMCVCECVYFHCLVSPNWGLTSFCMSNSCLKA